MSTNQIMPLSTYSENLQELTYYQPGMAAEVFNKTELTIHKLSSNESLLGASPYAITAAKNVIDEAHIYPVQYYDALKVSLSSLLSVSPLQITIGNGSENILELIVKTYLNKEVEAIISEYTFLLIPLLIQHYGAIKKVVKAKYYGHDLIEILKSITAKTRVIFLVNPNNPTGTYFTEEEFNYFIALVPANVIIVIDEAYFEYSLEDDYPKSISYLSKYPNLIIVRTFSKAYGLAALRVGYAISSADVAALLNKARLPFNLNAPGAKAACVALEDQAHLNHNVILTRKNKKIMEAELSQLKINYIPSIANFITLQVADGQHVYIELIKYGLIVKPLKLYGMPNHLRVTVGTAEQNECFLSSIALMVRNV